MADSPQVYSADDVEVAPAYSADEVEVAQPALTRTQAIAGIRQATSPQAPAPAAPSRPRLDIGPTPETPARPRSIAEGLETEQEERQAGMPLVRGPRGITPVPRPTQPLSTPAGRETIHPPSSLNGPFTSLEEEQAAVREKQAQEAADSSIPRNYERVLAAGRTAGQKLGTGAVSLATSRAQPIGDAAVLPNPFSTQEETRIAREHPAATGIAKAAGGFAGQMAVDPVSYVFMGTSEAVSPVLERIVSTGFRLGMGVQAVRAARDLQKNWKNYSPEKRYEIATEAGLTGAMAVGARQFRDALSKPYEGLPAEPGARARELFRNVVYKSGGGSLPDNFTAEEANAAYRQALNKLRDPQNPERDSPLVQELTAAHAGLKAARGQNLQTEQFNQPSNVPRSAPLQLPAGDLETNPPTRAEIAEAQEQTNYAGPEQAKAQVLENRRKQSEAVVSGETAVTPAAGAEPQTPAPAPQDLTVGQRPERFRPIVPEPVAATPAVRATSPPAKKPGPAAAEPVTYESHEVEIAGSAEGAKRDTAIMAQVKEEHPDWTLSQQLQEAAKRAQPTNGAAPKPQFKKGDNVTLPDGRRGIVDYISPADKTPAIRLNVGGEKVELTKQKEIDQLQPATKYAAGSTQANIPKGSEAHQGLEAARQRISDSDTAGQGKDIDGNHVTLRYGLKSQDLAGVKKYLASLQPFEATLGKTASFPPSKNSDGAAVIMAPIESPELHKINAEIEKHGEFEKSDFPEYKPHATIAYVKPEKANRYVGMSVTAGKKFTVNEIAISDRNGDQQIVKLEGKGPETKYVLPSFVTQGLTKGKPGVVTGRPDSYAKGVSVQEEPDWKAQVQRLHAEARKADEAGDRAAYEQAAKQAWAIEENHPYTADEILERALGRYSGSKEFWQRVRERGATNEELKEVISSRFGVGGGSGPRGSYATAAGKEPKLFFNPDNPHEMQGGHGKPFLKGKPLVDAVRKLLQIPEPKGAASESQTAQTGRPVPAVKEKAPAGEKQAQAARVPAVETTPRGPLTNEEMNKAYSRQKAALTKAEGLTDHQARKFAVLKAATQAVNEWESKFPAWPDNWSRWQRALDDAYRKFNALTGTADQAPRLEDLVGKDVSSEVMKAALARVPETSAIGLETAIKKAKDLVVGAADHLPTAQAAFEKLAERAYRRDLEPAELRNKNTDQVYKQGDQWTPERQALQAKIKSGILGDKPSKQQPTLIILGGGAASGKSFINKAMSAKFPDAVGLDVDEIKFELPEWGTFTASDPLRAAGRLHNESSEIGASILDAAMNRNNDIIYDGVAGKPEKIAALIKRFESVGYKVEAHFIDAEMKDAVKAMVERFDKNGRFIAPQVMHEGHVGAARTYHEVIVPNLENHSLHVNHHKEVSGVKQPPELVHANRKAYNETEVNRHRQKGGLDHGRTGSGRQNARDVEEISPSGPRPPRETPQGGEEGPPARTAGGLDEAARGQGKDRVATLIDRFHAAMQTNQLPTNPKELRDMAREAAGGNPSEYIDDVYDALEGATNRRYREAMAAVNNPTRLRDRLQVAESIESQIAKRIRSLDIVKLQQFSTPHTISEGAGYAADVQKGDRVLEPTAGTGNLIEPVRDKAGDIFAAELDPRRVAVLRANGYLPHEGDFLRTPVPKNTQVAITNPPWGKISTTRYKALDVPSPWGRFGDVSERFFVKAFNDLAPGGRISAVMPTTLLGKASQGFMKWLKDKGTLRAIIQSPPGAYDNRGTTVDSLLLVADKGKVADAEEPIVRVESNAPKDWNEYAKAVEPLGAGGTHARKPTSVVRGEEPAPAVRGGETLPRPAGPNAGPGRPVPVRVPAKRGPGQGAFDVRPESAGLGPSVVPGADVHESVDSPGADGASLPEPTPAVVPKSPRTLRPDLAAKRRAEFKEASDSPVFAPYAVRSGITGNPHPRQVVETRSLAGAPAPLVSYRPSKGVYDAHARGALSDEQFDIAAIAGQANDAGHALMVADDVGVGKSREIAAIAIDILEKGKGKRGLFTSKSEVNLRDLERQMKIVAGVDPNSGTLPFKYIYLRDFKNASERANKKTPYEPIPAYDNAVYVVESTNLTPYARAISELAPDFVLADEVHTYKNDDAGIGKTWKALHIDWLGRKVPINYFSATPATTLDELEYLYGLREWPIDGFADWVARKTGHGTPEQAKRAQDRAAKLAAGESIEDQVGTDASEVSRVNEFARLKQALEAAIKAGDREAEQQVRSAIARAEKNQKKQKWGQRGPDVFHVNVTTAEMEQIMREMKMKGKYIARDLWRGGVEFQEKPMPLNKEESESWNKAINYMRDVERAFNLYANENETMRKGFGITAFLQAAAKRKLFDIRLERAISEAKASLERGEQPVISTININETKEGEGYLAAALRSINVAKIIVDDQTGEATDLGEIPEAVAVKNELTERAATEFPPSPDPIAVIQKAFGKDKVAIITGAESPKMRLKMKQEFQSGAKQVAVISGAGKTGISLHHVTETTGPAKGRRHMIEADYEWSATTFKQELGRVDRAGQLTPPKITALTLGSAAERKFVATIANRMKTLGAVSKGSAESTGTGALEQFELGGDVDNMVLRDSWKTMDKDLQQWFRGRKFMDVGTDGAVRPKNSIEGASLKDFLLQLQLMPIDIGNRVWDHFWKFREETYGSQAVAEAMTRKTQKFSGDVLRTVQLKPDLSMYEVKDAAGHRSAILSGMVTEYMPLIQDYLESGHERNAATGMTLIRKQRQYITFTDSKGQQISGLSIRPSAMGPISKRLGKAVVFEHTPETIMKDLEAGDHVPVEHDWSLRVGKGGEKKGKIIIEGAGMLNTDRGKAVLPHGAKYSPVGNFFYLPDEAAVNKFLERYPIRKEAAKGEEPETERQEEPEGMLVGEAGSFTPAALHPANIRASYNRLIQTFQDKTLGIGDKYWKVKEHDPEIADTLHLVDNAPRYFREKAQANLKGVTDGLSDDQLRLAHLMVDSDSRDELRANHPDEYDQATNDPKIMAAVKAFEPLQQELTADREALGWPVRKSLTIEEDQLAQNPFVVKNRQGSPVADFKTERQAEAFVEKNATNEPHLKRTYPEHSKNPLPGNTGAGPSTGSFYADKGLRPPKMDRKAREASAEYHYEHGRKDFSGYLESYAQTKTAVLKQGLFDELADKGTLWKAGTAQPAKITYNGEEYVRPDMALKAKQGGATLEPYAVYDPSRGEKFLIRTPEWSTVTTGKPGIGPNDRYLAPKAVVDALENYDASRGGEGPGKLRRFFQEQIVGLFGPAVHVNNIVRHLGQAEGLGAFDPRSWKDLTRLMFSSKLRERMQQGVDDSTIDMLVQRGAYTDWRDIGNLNAYIGGNFNPANWMRSFGKGVLFNPKFMGGWGGLDPKARVLVADYLKEHVPGITDQEIADNVNAAFGEYNRANWTERQKALARFMLFPGWDFASAKWFLKRPFVVGVAGAAALLAINLVLHKLGKNKGDDWIDFSYIHYGDRKYRTGLLADSFGQHLTQPLLSAAEAYLKDEDVTAGAEEGAIRGAGGVIGTLRPEIQLVAEQIFNRKFAGSASELVKPEDKNLPGKVLPNRDLEKRAIFAALKAFPFIQRFVAPDQTIDIATGVGSVLGVTNYKYGAEERLRANAAKAAGLGTTLDDLAKTDPQGAQAFVEKPSNSVYLIFKGDLEQMTKDLKEIDDEVSRVKMAGELTQKERKDALADLAQARTQLLLSAETLNDQLSLAKMRKGQ